MDGLSLSRYGHCHYGGGFDYLLTAVMIEVALQGIPRVPMIASPSVDS
jgi:hypothetical protein